MKIRLSALACVAMFAASPALAQYGQYAQNGHYGQNVSYYQDAAGAPATTAPAATAASNGCCDSAVGCCGGATGCDGAIGNVGGFFNRGCGSSCDSACSTGCRPGFLGKLGANKCGSYISITGGWVDLNRYVGEAPPPPPRTFAQRFQDFNDGWCFGGALGSYLNNGNRSELEFFYRNNSAGNYTLDQYTGNTLFSSQTWDADGNVNSYSAMYNLYKDFGFLGGNVVPYVGGGAGIIYVDGDINVPATGGAFYIDDTALAWQIMTGLNVNLTPTVACFTEFRYQNTTEVDFLPVGGGGGPANAGNFNYENANVNFGVRITK